MALSTVLLGLLPVIPATARAQQRQPWVAPVTSSFEPTRTIALPDSVLPLRRSTSFGERTLFGLLTGIGGSIGLIAAYGGGGPPAGVFVSTYALAAATGVELVALPQEGARPLGTLLGAAIGTGTGLLSVVLTANCEYCDEPPPGAWFAAVIYAFAVPIGAAAGHGLWPRSRAPALRAVPDHPVPGATLRLERSDGKRSAGQVVALSNTAILLRRWVAITTRGTTYDTLSFRLDSIGRAWVRRGTAWQRGAIIGALAGAAVGGAALLSDDHGVNAAAPLLVCTGALIGGVFGSATSRWKPIPWPPGAASGEVRLR